MHIFWAQPGRGRVKDVHVAAYSKAALGEVEVLEASQHHSEGKLAQAWGGCLQQEQGCLLH